MALRKAKQDDSAAIIEQLHTEIATLKKRVEMWENRDDRYVTAQKHLGGIQNRRIAKLIEVSAATSNNLREIAATIITVANNLAAERVQHTGTHEYKYNDPAEEREDAMTRQQSVDAMIAEE